MSTLEVSKIYVPPIVLTLSPYVLNFLGDYITKWRVRHTMFCNSYWFALNWWGSSLGYALSKKRHCWSFGHSGKISFIIRHCWMFIYTHTIWYYMCHLCNSSLVRRVPKFQTQTYQRWHYFYIPFVQIHCCHQ